LKQARRIALEDAMRLFKFFRECDEFETWMKEKVTIFVYVTVMKIPYVAQVLEKAYLFFNANF
jgi:hypothetical protein